MASWAPWIGGFFLGWLGCWLLDKWFLRDAATPGAAGAGGKLAEAHAQIARLQTELQRRDAAAPGQGGRGGDDLRGAIEALSTEFQTLRQDIRYQDTESNAMRMQLERLTQLLEELRPGLSGGRG